MCGPNAIMEGDMVADVESARVHVVWLSGLLKLRQLFCFGLI